MKIDSDNLQVSNTNFVEPVDICMLELGREWDSKLVIGSAEKGVENAEKVDELSAKPVDHGADQTDTDPSHVCMVELVETVDTKMVDPVAEEETPDLVGVYPKPGETLVEFLSKSQ